MNMSSNGDTEGLTVSSSPLVSSAFRLSAAPSGSFLFHVPAERRGSDPLWPAPLVPQTTLGQREQPSIDVTLIKSVRTTLCCKVLLFPLCSAGLIVWIYRCPSSISFSIFLFLGIAGRRGPLSGNLNEVKQTQGEVSKSRSSKSWLMCLFFDRC